LTLPSCFIAGPIGAPVATPGSRRRARPATERRVLRDRAW
jgi:hypothetical protein